MGGIESNRHRFIFRLKQDMDDEIMFSTSPGTATIITLKDKAKSILKLEKDNDEDNSFAQINFVAKKIVSETKVLNCKFDKYTMLNDNIFNGSETLLHLLSSISEKINFSLPTAMIGSIVASTILSKPTMLQIGLGLVARSRDVIKHLHDYGVCFTYQETCRFEVSEAVRNIKSSAQELRVENGLIQVVSDNFSANINTQNGIKQTNGMATIVTQTQSRYSQQFEMLYSHVF